MGLFLGIVHIFLNVSAKFQHYNIFFQVPVPNWLQRQHYIKKRETLTIILPVYVYINRISNILI